MAQAGTTRAGHRDDPAAHAASQALAAAELAARLDRLPATRSLWTTVGLLSLGALFEYYDLFYTAYVAPGMAKSGLFTPQSLGPFDALAGIGVTGFGTFVFATFAGLWVGTTAFGGVADRYGRRVVFTWSLVWYSLATLLLAFQTSGFGVDLARFVAGIGLGVELVTVDTYIAEIVPAAIRGRAYALNQVVTFLAVPIVALLAWKLVPLAPLGVDGWRWVVLVGTVGAVFVWIIRRGVPESPRWLARQGRLDAAERVVRAFERAAEHDLGRSLPPAPPVAIAPEPDGRASFAEIWSPPYRTRTVMMSVFQFCQTIGFYGFAAWVPTLLIAKGIDVTRSLQYSFTIAVVNPFGPLLGMLVADRIERKWQICAAAIAAACFGLLFGQAGGFWPVILLGVLVTLANNWMSFAFHGYQAELFPTRVRARAVGFTYSWSRLSGAFAGLVISALLARAGVGAVFVFIAGAMAIVVLAIGIFGPRTQGRPLEDISR